MTLLNFFFYVFSIATIAAGLMVITFKNPVYAVLSLIFAFVNAAGLFLLLKAEFLAMILIIVYVGAVAVLFLFVVMMLDVDFSQLKQGFLRYLPLGALVGIGVLVELAMMVATWVNVPSKPVIEGAKPVMKAVMTNTEALGRILYTDYALAFQLAGLVLFTAMIGAIVLTLHHKSGVKRQNVSEQNARTPQTAIEIKKVPSRTGV